jgi:hypothetical protein
MWWGISFLHSGIWGENLGSKQGLNFHRSNEKDREVASLKWKQIRKKPSNQKFSLLWWSWTRGENRTDIFWPYSRPNLFRGIQICPYPSSDIQHLILYPYLSGTWIRGTQNQRSKRANPRGIRALKPPKKCIKAPPTRVHRAQPAYMWGRRAPSTTFRLVRGPLDGKTRPRKISDSHDPGSSRSTLPYPPTHWQTIQCSRFHQRGIAPPAWEEHPCLIILFTVHPGMDGEKAATIHTTSSTILPSAPPRRTRRQPPRPDFLGLSIIRSSSTPSATSRPGLDRRWSTKEQRSHVDHRG